MSGGKKINKPLAVGATLSGIPIGILGTLALAFSIGVFSLAPMYAIPLVIITCLFEVGICSFFAFAHISFVNQIDGTEENDYSFFSVIKDFCFGFVSGIIYTTCLQVFAFLTSSNPVIATFLNISLIELGIAAVGFFSAPYLPKIGNATIAGTCFVGKMILSGISNLFTFTLEGIGALLACCFSRKKQVHVYNEKTIHHRPKKNITNNQNSSLPIVYPPVLKKASTENLVSSSSAHPDTPQDQAYLDRGCSKKVMC